MAKQLINDDDGMIHEQDVAGDDNATLMTCATPSDVGIDADKRTMTATIMTGKPLRNNTVAIITDGIQLDGYRKNPVVLWGHNHLIPPIAMAMWVKSDGATGLISKAQFATKPAKVTGDWLPDIVLDLYAQKVLRGTSIGLMTHKNIWSWDDSEDAKKFRAENKKMADCQRVVLESELLEWSCVSVPMDPGALKQAASDGLRMSIHAQALLGIDLTRPQDDTTAEQAAQEQLQAAAATAANTTVITPNEVAKIVTIGTVAMTGQDIEDALLAMGEPTDVAKFIKQQVDAQLNLTAVVSDAIDKAMGRV